MRELVVRFETYSRLSGHQVFKLLAEGQLMIFKDLYPRAQKLRYRISEILSRAADPADPPGEYYDAAMGFDALEEQRDQSCMVACVFTAMYFEAFIYDYAASCLGDKYVHDHLDKLDFISKWIVIPRLTVGKELDKSRPAYAALLQLQKDRNSLVHLKSRKMSFSREEIVELFAQREDHFQRIATNCQSALSVVIKELHEIDPTHPSLQFIVGGGEKT